MLEMEMLTKKTRNCKHKTQIEKRDAKYFSNRKSYRKLKERKKWKEIIFKPIVDFNNEYQRGLFKYNQDKPYSHFVTITHAEKVTLKKNIKEADRLLYRLEANGYIAGSFSVSEFKDGTYHTHILLIKTFKSRNIAAIIIKAFWKPNGFSDVIRIETQKDKETMIKYCIKQLKPLDRSNRMQELIDSWKFKIPGEDEKYESDIFKNEGFLKPLWTQKLDGLPIFTASVTFDLPSSLTAKNRRIDGLTKSLPLAPSLLGLY